MWGLFTHIYTQLQYQYPMLLFLAVASVGVYGIIGAGWRCNRKYSVLGSLRSIAQSISYEVVLFILVILNIVFYNFSLALVKMIPPAFMFLPMVIIFITLLAETNRSPFDFAEG